MKQSAAVAQAPPPAVVRRGLSASQARELVTHLVIRELALAHRGTLLGWTWPLTRQLAQLGVLVFIFGHVVNLHIPHYAAFVFTGLVAWTWFSIGVGTASWSLITRRHLVFQPNCPPVVLPIVTVTVPLADVAMALPVLVAIQLASGSLHWTVVFLVPLFAVQLVLMVGIAWIVAALSVYLRDIPNIVSVALLTLFYATPVFFTISRVPERFRGVLLANPIGTLIESYRAVTMGTPFPPAGALAGTAVGSVILAAIGLRVFRALEGGFVDEL